MDVRAKVALGIGVAGLALGVLAIAVPAPVLAPIAGALALVAGGLAISIASTMGQALRRAALDRAEAERTREELHELASVFNPDDGREDAGTRPAPGPMSGQLHEGLGASVPVYEPISGLLDPRYFAVLVEQRVAAARRHLQPVSVAVFQLDAPHANGPTTTQSMQALGEVLRSTLRECDAVCSLGPARAGAVLDGTAEQGAVWATERVRTNLRNHAVGRSMTISTGIASYPTHALDAAALMTLSTHALHAACRRGADGVEIARVD